MGLKGEDGIDSYHVCTVIKSDQNGIESQSSDFEHAEQAVDKIRPKWD